MFIIQIPFFATRETADLSKSSSLLVFSKELVKGISGFGALEALLCFL